MGRTSDAKERLLDVAFQLIWDQSYGGVSVDQICERAGVNKGSFYYFFETKADLAVAAYEESWRLRQPDFDRIFSAEVAPLDRLSQWCSHVYRSQKEKAKKYGHVCGCPYSSIGAELATRDDKIRSKVEELISRGTRYVEGAIADAKKQGSISISDVKLAARHVFSFVLGMVLQAKIHNDVELLKNLEPTVLAILGVSRAFAAAS